MLKFAKVAAGTIAAIALIGSLSACGSSSTPAPTAAQQQIINQVNAADQQIKDATAQVSAQTACVKAANGNFTVAMKCYSAS